MKFKKSPTEAQEWGSKAMPEHEANETRIMGPHEEEKPSVIGERAPHSFPKAKAGAHGFNHGVQKRDGHMRLSGHAGAHRIGKK